VDKRTVLLAVPGLEAGMDEPHRTWVRFPGGDRVPCGPFLFEILAVFREPRSLQEGFSALAARVPGTSALAEATRDTRLLHRAGILLEQGAAKPVTMRAAGFSTAGIHVAMLNDRERTETFLTAISRVVRPGDVVVDLGSGTGILAIAAAKAGAARVYAIEAGGMADAAAALIAQSGMSDRITLLRTWSTGATIDQRADVLITETLGNDPWSEGIVGLVADARRRLLKPHARVIPSRIRWIAQPVCVPLDQLDELVFSAAAAERWSAWYGIDFGPLVDVGQPKLGAPFVRQSVVASWTRPTPPVVLTELDLERGGVVPAVCDGSAISSAEAVIDGAVICWEATLSSGCTLTTVPGQAPLESHWKVQFVPLKAPIGVKAGDVIDLSFDGRQRRLSVRIR
jgi:hypothetical protein